MGLIERKSLVLTMPSWVTDELFPHLLRGLIDGDGNISKSRQRISLTGTHALLSAIQDRLLRILNINSGLHKYKNKSVSYLYIGGKEQSHKLLDYMY